jgi:hypothetical protein
MTRFVIAYDSPKKNDIIISRNNTVGVVLTVHVKSPYSRCAALTRIAVYDLDQLAKSIVQPTHELPSTCALDEKMGE